MLYVALTTFTIKTLSEVRRGRGGIEGGRRGEEEREGWSHGGREVRRGREGERDGEGGEERVQSCNSIKPLHATYTEFAVYCLLWKYVAPYITLAYTVTSPT